MKFANGYGSITKLSGKRRKPWMVRITEGRTYDEEKDEKTICLYGEFTSFNAIQKHIEETEGLELVSAEFTRLPNCELVELSEEDKAGVEKLLEKLEEDEDVQNVYHTMKE